MPDKRRLKRPPLTDDEKALVRQVTNGNAMSYSAAFDRLETYYNQNNTPEDDRITRKRLEEYYARRKELTPAQHEFVKKFYYKKSGYAGRDKLYAMLVAEYERQNVPQADRISRRQLYHFFLARQKVAQLHKPAPASDVTIFPITTPHRYHTAQADLIIRTQDTTARWRAILVVVDVATRKLYTEALRNTEASTAAEAMKKIMTRARRDMSPQERESRPGGWKRIHTDNGGEFKDAFRELLRDRGVTQKFGAPNRPAGQGLVERVNRSLQISMQKQITATGTTWWNAMKTQTKLYNTKPHRKLRTQDADGKYTYYSPNDLLTASAEVLKELHENKMKELHQSRKIPRQDLVKVGSTVRVLNKEKQKAAIKKGFRQSWSEKLYTVYKIKAGGPVLRYYVHEKGKPDKKPKKTDGEVIPYTIKDLQLIDKVEEPPEEEQDEPDENENRRVTRAQAAPRRGARARRQPERYGA